MPATFVDSAGFRSGFDHTSRRPSAEFLLYLRRRRDGEVTVFLTVPGGLDLLLYFSQVRGSGTMKEPVTSSSTGLQLTQETELYVTHISQTVYKGHMPLYPANHA
jgi:hypothetical protein